MCQNHTYKDIYFLQFNSFWHGNLSSVEWEKSHFWMWLIRLHTVMCGESWINYSYDLQHMWCSEMPTRLMEHQRDLRQHRINIYIEYNLKTHLGDLILLALNHVIFACLFCFGSLWNLFIYSWIHHNNKCKNCSIYTFVHTEPTCIETFISTFLHFLCLLRTVLEGWYDLGSS